MPTTPVTPYVPQYITVHLGAPSAAAENVTVSFPEYVKNVASSEIYPTWEPAAIRANILAIISFALNRVYTEYYPSRGYPFNITASTAYDQKFIKGRNIFENISQMVDEIFNSYIRRTGFVEPLAAKFCNGTTTTCDGLSQWGSQAMAEQGADSVTILRNYYGDWATGGSRWCASRPCSTASPAITPLFRRFSRWTGSSERPPSSRSSNSSRFSA